MNKILASLLFLIFISGCVDLPEFVEKASRTTPGTISFTETPEATQDEFTMYINDNVAIGEKLIILKDIHTNGEVTIFVDGTEEVIETTKNPEIVNGLEITTEEISYGSETSEHYVRLKAFPFKVGKDEYYLKPGDKTKVKDLTVTFKDLTKLGGAKVLIEGNEFLIPSKETLIVRNIKITNKRAFDDAYKSKRSVVLQIEALS